MTTRVRRNLSSRVDVDWSIRTPSSRIPLVSRVVGVPSPPLLPALATGMDGPGSGSSRGGAGPPPSASSRYRSKACLGAMFHTAGLRDAGVPPLCLGVTYRKSDPPPPTDLSSRHGAYKFTCVGFGQCALGDARAHDPRDPHRPTPPGGAGPREARLPYCEGFQILVADVVSRDRLVPSAEERLALVRRRLSDRRAALERLERDLPATPEREAFAEAMRDAIRVAERGAKALEREAEAERAAARPPPRGGLDATPPRSGPPGPSGPGQAGPRRREEDANKRAEAEAIIDSMTADFDARFVKQAGKILRNMRRHAEYVGRMFAGGGGAGGGIARGGEG